MDLPVWIIFVPLPNSMIATKANISLYAHFPLLILSTPMYVTTPININVTKFSISHDSTEEFINRYFPQDTSAWAFSIKATTRLLFSCIFTYIDKNSGTNSGPIFINKDAEIIMHSLPRDYGN